MGENRIVHLLSETEQLDDFMITMKTLISSTIYLKQEIERFENDKYTVLIKQSKEHVNALILQGPSYIAEHDLEEFCNELDRRWT